MNKRVNIFIILFLLVLTSINAQTDSLNNFESVLQTILSETVIGEENDNIYDLV